MAAHSSVRAVGLSFLQLFPDFILENSAVWLCTGAERHADDLVFDVGLHPTKNRLPSLHNKQTLRFDFFGNFERTT